MTPTNCDGLCYSGLVLTSPSQSLYFLSKIRDIRVVYWEEYEYYSQIHLNSDPGLATFQLRIWATPLPSELFPPLQGEDSIAHLTGY